MFCRAFLGISALLNDTAGPELVFLCRAMNFHSTFFPAPGFSLFNRGQSSTSMLIHGQDNRGQIPITRLTRQRKVNRHEKLMKKFNVAAFECIIDEAISLIPLSTCAFPSLLFRSRLAQLNQLFSALLIAICSMKLSCSLYAVFIFIQLRRCSHFNQITSDGRVECSRSN
jgi:hypothetical protein